MMQPAWWKAAVLFGPIVMMVVTGSAIVARSGSGLGRGLKDLGRAAAWTALCLGMFALVQRALGAVPASPWWGR